MVPHLITNRERIPAARYYNETFFLMENMSLWPHVWQMAARLDQIPEVGDWIEYKILDKSIVVVRSKSGVKAFHNACRHRGVRLLRYDFKAGGIARDLQLTLNVDNVFDTDPPEFRGDPIAGQFGYLNSLTLGRLVQFGISKKF